MHNYIMYDHKFIHLHMENEKDNEFFTNSLLYNSKEYFAIISHFSEIYFSYD